MNRFRLPSKPALDDALAGVCLVIAVVLVGLVLISVVSAYD